jgi:uncharacterized protein (DUF433 family)
MGTARKVRAEHRETSVFFSARIPGRTKEALETYAEARGASTSSVAARLLEEGLRMERFPGIDFRWTPSGRQAHVTGTGLSAWEMNMIWESHGRNVNRALKNYPHLKAAQIQVGSAYIEAYPREKPSIECLPFVQTVRV